MESDELSVNCPTCSKSVIWNADSPYRPFCCKRCQLIDLGEWANEEKAIPCDIQLTEEENWSEQENEE